jgi:VWFA-related protein
MNALALLVCAAVASSSEQKPPLVFGSDVALVQVPVFVSGKDGAASRGLGADDFQVEQDGKPVKVVSFRFVDTTSVEQQDSIRNASAARRRFLLLFDKSFTDPGGLARARNYAKEFVLKDLAESDLVAVATFDFMNGIRLVANFTEDRRVAEHAIHTLGIASLSKISDPLALAADMAGTDLTPERRGSSSEAPAELINDVLAVLARQARSAEEQSYRARVMTLLESFEQLGDSLRRIEGRKQVVYFSTGFNSTMLVGQDVADQTQASAAVVGGRLWEVDSEARFGDSRMRTVVRDALQRLSRADAVVHSIDLGGLGYQEQYNQTVSDRGMGTRDAGGRESLSIIANETGGRFYKDANNLGPVLREMADMTSRYYVLGVQPREGKLDGGFRKLKVRVSPKGLRVSHRPGFFEKSTTVAAAPPPVLQRQFEAAELLTARNDGQSFGAGLPFGVLILPVPTDAAKQSLGIVIQVPKSSLAGSAGPLEVFGYAIARSGEVEDHFAHFLRLEPSGPESGDGSKGVSFAGRFDVPPGDYTLKFLAQRPGGEALTRFFDVTVPKRQASSGFLLPPLFAESPRAWVEVSLKSRTDSGLPLKIDAGGPFLPRADLSVRPGRRERLVLVAYDPGSARDPAVDVDIRSVLSDASGKRFPPGAISVEKVLHGEDGRRSYVLGFTPHDVPPGDYTLRIHLGEASSVLQSYTRLKVLPRESADNR